MVGFDPEIPDKQYDAVLLDIDHSPSNLLDPSNANFYSEAGLQHIHQHLQTRRCFCTVGR